MGQTQSLSTQVEIDAAPETVRKVFMDFPNYKQWSLWKFEPIPSSSVTVSTLPDDLVPDRDSLKVDLKGMVFRPLVKEVSPSSFAWEGSLYGLLAGRHDFVWAASTSTPKGTTMVQSETFRGVLAFMMAPNGWLGLRESTLENWDGFFGELKRECERRQTAS